MSDAIKFKVMERIDYHKGDTPEQLEPKTQHLSLLHPDGIYYARTPELKAMLEHWVENGMAVKGN